PISDAYNYFCAMKTLILIRHAKSSWDEIGLSDAERPLNERGKKDAPEMGKRLKKKELKIDLFLSSPAKRARRTARLIAEEFNLKKDEIVLEEKLYGAGISTFSEVVSNIDDKYDTAALFSHNPGITDYVNTLTSVRVDNMPTAAMYAVQADVESWKEFKDAEKKFLFFDYPKNPLGI
ncbi:MAG TPA: histidine phosphatase family protein, partial [Flavisolibacter sp.]|nr:histidine phosphatase family protein [Flavisolibacter sp.]